MAFTQSGVAQEQTLGQIQKFLISKKFVDLTHAFEPGIPHWGEFPDEKRELIFSYEKGRGTLGSGFFAARFMHVG
ncbi:MAG: cyclase family protein, partial [Chthoniobacterales bacterium]